VAALPLVSAILANLGRAIKERRRLSLPKKRTRSPEMTPPALEGVQRATLDLRGVTPSGTIDLRGVTSSISSEMPSSDHPPKKRLQIKVCQHRAYPLHFSSHVS
jgi:hypothetical protein